jgi:YD repeat-containing protein
VRRASLPPLALGLAACGGPAGSAEIANATGPMAHQVSACPDFGDLDRIASWAYVLFPSCPKPPFDVRFPVCVHDCPHPCRERSDDHLYTFTYDAQGRWLATYDRGSPQVAVTYAGDRLSTSADLRFRYDGHGKLTAATSPTYDASYRYNADGDLASIHDEDRTEEALNMSATFVYAHHRLVTQHGDHKTIDYHYEGDRVSASDEHAPSSLDHVDTVIVRTRFAYDERGRLRSTDRVTIPNDPSFAQITWKFDYDERDRLIRSVNDRGIGDFITTYEYCD